MDGHRDNTSLSSPCLLHLVSDLHGRLQAIEPCAGVGRGRGRERAGDEVEVEVEVEVKVGDEVERCRDSASSPSPPLLHLGSGLRLLCGAVEPGADVVVVVVVGLDQRQRDGRHKDNEHEGRGGHSFKKIHSIY